MRKHDFESVPLYGCLTGISLPVEEFRIGPGLLLRRTFVDTFGGWSMGFATPLPGKPHPAPWAAVHGASSSFLQARVELVISETLNGFLPTATAWLVASLLRLQVNAPVRLAVLANMSFGAMSNDTQQVEALAFETAANQWGAFRGQLLQIALNDLLWLKRILPVAANLYQQDRFQRAYSIYDEALWSAKRELVTVLIWTALEILFDASAEQNKTRAISQGVSQWIGHDKADCDRAYSVVRDLYMKRGRVVHVGRQIENPDFLQSLQICRAVFGNVLGREELPSARLTAAK